MKNGFQGSGENGGRPSPVDGFPVRSDGSGRGSTPVCSRGYNRQQQRGSSFYEPAGKETNGKKKIEHR